MNKQFVNILLVFIIFFSIIQKTHAHPINPNVRQSSLRTNIIGFAFEKYSRPTQFFSGFQKDAEFTNKMIIIKYPMPYFKNIEFMVNFGMNDLEIFNRKTTDNGYDIRIGFIKDIWGDQIVFPLWKWQLDFSRGMYKLKDFNSDEIMINFDYTSVSLSIYASKKYYFLSPYIGALFFYSLDKFYEKITDKTKKTAISGLSPSIGIVLEPIKNIIIRGELDFLDINGFSVSSEIRL